MVEGFLHRWDLNAFEESAVAPYCLPMKFPKFAPVALPDFAYFALAVT